MLSKKLNYLKAITITLAMTFALASISNIAVSAEEKVSVIVDGKKITFPDEQPYVNNDNRTLVPVRFITEAMGCSVTWEETRELVTISKGKTRILLQIGQNYAIVNNSNADVKKEFDTSAVLKNNRTMVPLRFVSETLGAGVAWDEVRNTVIIRSDGTVEAVATPTPTIKPISTSLPVATSTPAATPASWRNVEVPMTLAESESDVMPEGFIKPQLVVKHHPDGGAGYFYIYLKNINDYKDTAWDYAYKVTCLNYDLINWTSGIPDIKRQDNIRDLADKFRYKYVAPNIWSSPSTDKKFVDMPEMGEVKINPGVVLDIQVEFYYAGLKQVYRDSIDLKQK